MIRGVSFRTLVPVAIAIAILAMWQVTPGFAKQKAGGSASARPGPAMTTYLIISPHTPENCLVTLDAVKAEANGSAELAKWEWGCMSGDHTGYMIVPATSPDDALKHVPEMERAQARAVALNKFTPEQIKAFHEAKQ
jgi:hypothetical protein